MVERNKQRYKRPPSERPHSHALRKGRVSVPNSAYFITKCADDYGKRVLAEDRCAEIIVGSLTWVSEEQVARLCGFVVMPDHWHAVFGLREEWALEQLMESVCKFTSRRINRVLGRSGVFWQDGYQDHAVRDREDFDGILLYMHWNPVKAKLVEQPEQWPYSTADPKYQHLIDWDWLGARFH